MPLNPFLALVLAFPLLFLIAVAGGYGGAKLRARALARELAEQGADLEGFDLRLKKLEGRRNREEQQEKEKRPPPRARALAQPR